MRQTRQQGARHPRVVYGEPEESRAYSQQYPQYPGATAYRTTARQPRVQARAATAYPEAPVRDPREPDSHRGSRSYRAWQEDELSGGSDVSLPRIRVTQEPPYSGAPGYYVDAQGPTRGSTGQHPAHMTGVRSAYAPSQAPTRTRIAPGRVVDAWPDDPTADPYDASPTASTRATGIAVRQAPTARPITREQRAIVIKHPWSDAPAADAPTADALGAELGADESGVHDFSQQLDTLIAVTSAHQQVVLPKAKPAKGQRAVRRMGVMAAVATRAGLGFLILMGIMTGITALTGHPPIPVQALSLPLSIIGSSDDGSNQHWTVDSALLSRIQPLTQLKRADQYDNNGQFNAWGGSACSAAVLAEILTAYGAQHATIGRMIDQMGSDISVQWGLVSYNGFAKATAKNGLRADMYVDHPLTYAQMLYLTNTLHIPIIVNVRATTGYYHYLSGGHFLVMTGGDAQTIRLVDSSEYYIKSLPINTFMWMYRNRSVAIVPKDFQYTLP